MKILIAEDDPVSRKALELTLQKWGYEVISTKNGDEAWQVLQREDAPQLVILDWVMPGMDGPELCSMIRAREEEPYTYILLLTAKNRSEDIVRGMEAGADDYITKPFDPSELRVRLRAGRRILNLQAELIAAREALRVQATHDPLTGLWNRAAILEILQKELDRSKREGEPLCVALADLDHFKRVNDSYGHAAGDAVLCEAAKRMTASVRSYDSVARYGGEEFLLVVPGCDEEKGLALAERIRERIAEKPIDTPAGPISITVSMGVATNLGTGYADMEALISAADAALYRAKSAGRNRVELATADDGTIKTQPVLESPVST